MEIKEQVVDAEEDEIPGTRRDQGGKERGEEETLDQGDEKG